MLKKENGINCTLDIFGNGPLLSSLQRRVKELELENVHFKGSVPDIADRLKDYNLYIISSSFEGFGIAVAEAMAAGLPVIVPNLSVLKEVTNGHALFFEHDKPQQLAGCIASVYKGEADMRLITAQGQQNAQRFRKDAYMHQLIQIYTKAGLQPPNPAFLQTHYHHEQ